MAPGLDQTQSSGHARDALCCPATFLSMHLMFSNSVHYYRSGTCALQKVRKQANEKTEITTPSPELPMVIGKFIPVLSLVLCMYCIDIIKICKIVYTIFMHDA